jgi:hypothetical protein
MGTSWNGVGGTHLARNNRLSVNCAQASCLPNWDSVLRGASVLQAQARPASITLDLLTSEVNITKLERQLRSELDRNELVSVQTSIEDAVAATFRYARRA